MQLSFTVPTFAMVGLLDELDRLRTLPAAEHSDVLGSLCCLWFTELERQCPMYRSMYDRFGEAEVQAARTRFVSMTPDSRLCL